MRKTIITFAVAVVALLGSALPAQAQFRFGLKAGVAVNSLHFNTSTFDSESFADVCAQKRALDGGQ